MTPDELAAKIEEILHLTEGTVITECNGLRMSLRTKDVEKLLELVNMESKPTDLTIGVIRRTSNPFNNTRQLPA